MYRRISMSHGLEPIKTYDQFSVLSALFRVFFFPFFFYFLISVAQTHISNEFAWKKECFYRKECPRDFFHLFHSFFSVFDILINRNLLLEFYLLLLELFNFTYY